MPDTPAPAPIPPVVTLADALAAWARSAALRDGEGRLARWVADRVAAPKPVPVFARGRGAR